MSADQRSKSLRGFAARSLGGHAAVTMSFGIATSQADGFDYDAVLAQADRALYQAKSSGRDRVCSPT